MTTQAPALPGEDVSARFHRLVTLWRAESQFMSNTAQMAILKSYQGIIGMGDAAVPLLLEELRREPDHWFWALEAITGENPVSPEAAGRLAPMAEAWVEWGVRRGLGK